MKSPMLPKSICLLSALAGCLLASAARAEGTAKPPNIVIVLVDDMGYSDLGCYGGDISTPNLDRLAGDGLRFTQFYNCGRCWPTRAALMTGYYPQQVRMDPPDKRKTVPDWTPSLPKLLKPLGYRSYHSGKWHIFGLPRPVADAGFDRSYFLADLDHDFHPKVLFEDDKPLPPVAPGSGYYTTTAVTDYAIKYLKEHAEKYPDRPFFTYIAYNVPHFPLQAPAEDIARYQGTYLRGWDVMRAERYRRQREMGLLDCALSAPEPWIRAPWADPGYEKQIGPGEVAYALPWSSLDAAQQRFQSAKMAIHAAMVDRMDREVGRVFDQIKAMGAWNNTVILFLSDNGASAEMLVRGDGNHPSAPLGSAETYVCMGPGWATMSNTPFRRHKMWVHEGGVSTPLIVHWPDGIAAHGEFRHDMGHVIDLVPTLYELASGHALVMPEAAPPLPGRSLVPAFAKDGTVQRDFIFFDHVGNRALRIGDWKLVSARIDNNRWCLYNLANDRAESVDLAAAEPDRVRLMAGEWARLEAQYRHDGGPMEPISSKFATGEPPPHLDLANALDD
jgi:arylsulfatase A-like enzyme